MVFTVIARTDDPEDPMLSLWNSPELQRMRAQNDIIVCGLLEENGRVKGALLIIDRPGRSDVDRLLDSLPYFRDGHFTVVEVLEGGDERLGTGRSG
jgi:hypothetical protein